MSDTPRTDAAWNSGFERVILSPAELARRIREQCAEFERENAALREAFAKAELLSDPAVAEGHYEYVEAWGHFSPNEIIVVMDRAAFNAARAKEAKP